MKTRETRLGLLAATVAIFALPSVAAAQPLVPPDNSAVTQYTETFPTVGGDKGAAKKKGGHSPAKVLDSHKTRKLKAQGPQGDEVAEVVEATAPTTSVNSVSSEEASDNDDTAAPAHRGDNPGGGESGGVRTASPAHRADEVEGSSGLGEVIAQATGSSSSGQMGMLLPFVILAALASSLIFLLRKRRETGSLP
jgi:hypothetical protein